MDDLLVEVQGRSKYLDTKFIDWYQYSQTSFMTYRYFSSASIRFSWKKEKLKFFFLMNTPVSFEQIFKTYR